MMARMSSIDDFAAIRRKTIVQNVSPSSRSFPPPKEIINDISFGMIDSRFLLLQDRDAIRRLN